jgi:putative transposase
MGAGGHWTTSSSSACGGASKYEDIYLKGYASLPELLLGLTDYFAFYNGERPHQSLGYRTPEAVYHSGTGGGAKIVDRFGEAELERGQRQTAAIEGDSPT